MRRLSALFPARLMVLFGNNRLIGTPEIRIADTTVIYRRKRLPEFLTGRFAAISDHERNNLACFPTESKPYPALICLLAHKRPDFIQFKQNATEIARNCRNQRLCQRRQRLDFFLTSQSQYCEQHRTFVPIHASYCALDRHVGLFLAVPLNRLSYRDCPDFVGGRSGRDTSACRSGQYHILSGSNCRNDGK